MSKEKDQLYDTTEDCVVDEAKEVEDETVIETEDIKEELSEVDLLSLRIKELETDNKKLQNDYAKAYADTENMRKRLTSEFESSRKYRIQSFAADILPVIDNLERALSEEPNEASESYYKGVEMIYNQLTYALKKEGVEEIEALDKEFDHNLHQAIMTEAVEGVDSNIVIEVLQKGYKLKDRVLRAAMVKVSE